MKLIDYNNYSAIVLESVEKSRFSRIMSHGIYGQRGFRSACAPAQADLNPHCPSEDTLITIGICADWSFWSDIDVQKIIPET